MSIDAFPAPGDVIAVLLATDQQQSVLANVRPQGSGAVSYTAYGFYPGQSVAGGSLGYTGQRRMPETGHYLLGNGYRALNVVMMRFNTPDSLSPFGRGGLNAYAYCAGDPINRVDPSGHVVSMLRGLAGGFLRPGQGRQAALKGSRYPLLAGGGVGATSTDPSSGFVGGVLDVARKSLFARTGTPSFVPEPGRRVIQQGLGRLSNEGELSGFPRRLQKVNENLISHNDANISVAHGEQYVQIAQGVQYGRISNATAHLRSAAIWSGVSGPEGLVGFAFNAAGSILGAADDHRLRSSGLALTLVTPPTSPTGRQNFDIRTAR